MPHSQYVAGREPPSQWDRVLAHAQTIPLALLSFAFGVLILVSIFFDLTISRSLTNAPTLVQATVAAPLIAGAPAVIWGTLNPRLRLSPLTAMATERAGSIATSGGAAAFALAILLSGNQLAIGTGIITAAVAVAFGLQAAALQVTEKRVRAHQQAEQHEG